MLFKIFHSFAENPLHAVLQALAIASEIAISLRRWSVIDNWHAECGGGGYKAPQSTAESEDNFCGTISSYKQKLNIFIKASIKQH